MVTDSTTTVTASLASGSDGILGSSSGSSLTATAVNGVVTFSDLTLTGLITKNYTPSFTAKIGGVGLTPFTSSAAQRQP